MNELLKAYLDNALPEEERTQVEAELSNNPALQAELEELRATSAYLEASTKPITITGLEQTLAALTTKPKRTLWYRSPYAVLAACTVVLAFGMSFYKPDFSRAEVAKDATFASTASSSEAADAAVSESISPTNTYQIDQPPADRTAKAKSEYRPDAEAGASLEEKARLRAQPNASSTTESWANKAGGSSASPSQANPTPQESQSLNRHIIKSASLSLRVKQLDFATAQTETIAKQYGGYIESSDRSAGTNVKYASYTLRVDSKKFDQAMTDLRKLGDVTSETTSGNDVTAQVADTEARLKQKRLEESQYQEVLKSAKKISDILEVKDYISNIREEIEATDAQLKALKNLSSLSTINVGLEQREEIKPAPRSDWLSNAWISAMNRFSGIGRTIVSTLINILVLAPFWLPFALGIWWWSRKRNRTIN